MSENDKKDQLTGLNLSDQLPRTLEEVKQYAYVFEKSGVFPDIKSLAMAMVKIIAGRSLRPGD